MNDVLEPLAARYLTWLALPASSTVDTSDEDAELVRAMPVVLRIERAEPPPRTALLEAAATAAVAVCLDERAAPDGEWHDAVRAWIDGRIRKVARRARGAHWQAAQGFPGLTVQSGAAEARALVPGLVAETPREIARLQISGSDLPHDEPGPPPGAVPVLWLNPHVEMTVGKAAAQVGHATMLLAALLHGVDDTAALDAWASVDYRCAVRVPTRPQWTDLHPADDPEAAWADRRVVAVRDAGFTEVDPGTITVLAQLP
ncbi:peptidyl-tRNA hydrolase [Herbihabitans rhizosphaerae]|uniref:peptidyl-tRNA hydrolase n=1 Tax=Herbihabitans rhizosphaerae TaxID=1872711 RepID=A0A4V2ERU2_9PSEU|nr:peptidyl-tRNA hydrolase [Herbihabitans rhizosphaerae]RZS34057.1 peptidyl-tRNA hydrolase [Herbihabitans rhizosphaerae]